MLRSASEDAVRLRAEQSEAYKALARLRLDALSRDQVVGRLDSAEQRVLDALDKRKAALTELAGKRAELAAAMAAGEERRDAEAAALEKAIDATEDLAEKTVARLASDPGWLERSKKAAAAEATAAAASAKTTRSEADREEKREPYEADALFMYLWKRGYGTAAYRAGRLVRYFDAKVARVIDYDTARPNFYMLNEIPLRLREHAGRLDAAAAAARTERESFERRALEADGIEGLEDAATAAEQTLSTTDADLEALDAKLAEADEQHAGMLDERNDPTFAGAIGGLAEAISREDLASLHKQAMATPTPEDEKIVASLREIEQKLVRREAEAEEVRKAAVDLAHKRAEFERSRDRFRSSGYDDPLGQFASGALIGSIIGEILRGVMNSRHLDDALSHGFSRRRSRSGGSVGGGLRLPRGGRRPKPLRMPRGGFRTGGSF